MNSRIVTENGLHNVAAFLQQLDSALCFPNGNDQSLQPGSRVRILAEAWRIFIFTQLLLCNCLKKITYTTSTISHNVIVYSFSLLFQVVLNCKDNCKRAYV